METIDELTVFLATATADGILGRLLYRGAAWSLMREEGVLPSNAPPLGATIETDLAEHGFALLRGAMALRALASASELTSKAFERAANAFEALVRNGDPEAPDRGFRRMIAAAAWVVMMLGVFFVGDSQVLGSNMATLGWMLVTNIVFGIVLGNVYARLVEREKRAHAVVGAHPAH